MKKLISFSLFAVIVLIFASFGTVNAQVVVARPMVPGLVIAAAPVYRGPYGGFRRFHRVPMVRPMPMGFVRPRFYPRPFVRVRARMW